MYSNLSQEDWEKIAQQARAKALADKAQIIEKNKALVNETAKVQAERAAGLVNDNLLNALTYGAKTGANNLEHSFDSAWTGLKHTGAELFGMDDAANSLAEKLRQNAQAQAQRQAEIDSQYNTNFGMLAKGVSDVTSGAIGMLPTIGAAVLTPQGKVAAAGKVAQIGGKALRALPSTGVLGVQAAGSGINQALNEGAEINEAKKYGVGSAVKEVATELPFAGIAKVPGLVKINNGVGKLVTEGVEEALAEYLDPYLQRATYNPNAENASWDDMLYSALIGAGTAGLINSGFAGAGKAANMALGTGKNKKMLPTAPKNAQNQGAPVQSAQNGAGMAQGGQTTEYLPRPDKTAQNQFIEVEKIRKQMEKEQAELLRQKNALWKQKTQMEQAEQDNLYREIKNLEETISLLRGTQSSAFDDALFNAMDEYTMPEQKPQQTLPTAKRQEETGKVQQEEKLSFDMPMSERTLDNVSNPKVKAYQSTHPEVKAFFREQAEIMLNDLNNMIDGGREYGFDPETRNVTTVRSQTRAASSQIERLLNAGMTKAQIRDGLERIIRDNGAENTANAKKVETTLDDALANGYQSMQGQVPKNLDYVYHNADIGKMKNSYNQLNSEESFANSADPAGLINELEYLNQNITERQQLIDAYSELLPDMSVYETMTAEELHNEMDKLESASRYAPDEIAGEMMKRHRYLELLEEGRVNEFIENENMKTHVANMEKQLADKKLSLKLPRASDEMKNIQKTLDEIEAKQAGISIFNKTETTPEGYVMLPRPTVAENETVAEESSTVQYEDFDVSQLPKDVFDFYDNVGQFGKKAGFNVRIVTGIENNANGMYDGQGNILIDGNKMTDTETISKVIGHEGFHYLKDTDEHKYIIDLAIKDGMQKDGLTKDQLIQKKIEDYYNRSKGDVVLDRDGALDEIGAEFMEKILADPKLAEQIWSEQPTLAQRIMRWLQDMVNRLTGKARENPNAEIYRKALDAYSRGLCNMQWQNRSQGKSRYMIANDDKGEFVYLTVDQDRFKNRGNKSINQVAAEIIKERYLDGDFELKDGSHVTGFVPNEGIGKFVHNRNAGENHSAKMRITPEVDNILSIADNTVYNEPDKINSKTGKKKHPWMTDWDKYKTRVVMKIDGINELQEFTVRPFIANPGKYERGIYDIEVRGQKNYKGSFVPPVEGTKKEVAQQTASENAPAMQSDFSAASASTSENIIPENQQEINTKTDTSGRQLTEQQADYFKNSKVRDENGNLLVMYHGTPNAGFTEFRSGTYFTPAKWYADGYHKQGASMLSHKKTADNPDTYEVYLNIEKPFDTRNPKERRIFEQEYYRKWGTGAPLADSGLPDWTDGMDLQEFIEENGYDYDGLILDEGAVGGYGEEVKSRGLSYVVFSPEQVKNVDNQTPTKSADIRYSLPKMPNQKYLVESDENLQAFMYGSSVVNEDGSPKVVYSGHGNTNLFGSSFDKKRATAGGFYFTANPDIASSYAKNKMGVKEYYEDGSEYRIKDEKGKYKLQLRDVYLTEEQAEKFDEWFEESLGWTFDRFVKERGGYDYRYRRLSKRRLADLYWLMSENGYTLPNTVYTSEGAVSGKSDFEELMDAMGIEWDSYSTNHGGVFPVYLSIRNPIDTSKPFPTDVMKRLERIASRERRMSWDELDEAHWTADYPVYKWIEDIKEMEETGEETYWATQVPTKARKILQEMGYDGIKDTGGKMGGEEHEVWIAFEPTQVKSAIGNRGTYDATKKDMRYSLDELVDEYGALPKGEDPYGTNRDIDVPRQTADDNRVSKWAGTAMEAEQVDDITVSMIERDMEQGRFTYEPSGNQEQIDRANGLINHTGWERQLEQFQNKYRSGQAMTADDIVLGERLIQEAQNTGDYKTAVDLIADIAAIGTELGRAVQALSVLKRLTPQCKVQALKRVEERINAGLIEQGQNPVKLPEEMLSQMLQAESQQMQSEIWDNCVQELANQVPATLADKINAWRYLAMLSNPKTHIRNVVGNSVMRGVSAVKRGIQTNLENRLLTAGEERYAELNRNVPQEYFDFAKWSWDNEGRERAKAGGGRYNDAIGQIEQNKRIFKNDKLETARKTNTELLDNEDMWFKEKTYIESLARYMHTNGLSPNALQSMASHASYSKGVEFALKEAYKGTFQEASKVANLLAQMENSSPAAKVVMGALVPFKKTPINILKRGVEYSPVGLMNGLYKMRHDVQTGKCTPAEAIDSIAAGLTGTGIMVLGYFMASMGMITAGAGEDDERKQWYDQSMGSQNYALVLPNGATATIDWLAPSVMPLMAGAELYSQLTSENPANENSSAVTSTLEAISKVANPVLEMSMLQGVTDALQSYNSGTTGVLSDLITSTATSYGGQFVPAVVGAAARTIDDTVRSSYAPKDSAFTKTGEKFARQQMNKIPFVSMLNNPSVDVWGNEVERAGGNIIGRAFNNFLNPATYSSDKRTELDKKLNELYEATGNSGVLPSSGTTYINESDSNPKIYLSANEYMQYGTTKGQKSYQYVNAFVNSYAYSQLADEDKAEIISDLYSLANYQAKKEALNGRGYNYVQEQYEKVLKSKMEPQKYYIAKYNMDLIADNVGEGQKKQQIAYLKDLQNQGAITDEQCWYLRRAMIGKFSKSELAACPYDWIKQL